MDHDKMRESSWNSTGGTEKFVTNVFQWRQMSIRASNCAVPKAGGYTGRQNCISNIVQHTNEEGYGHGIWRI